MLLCVLGYRVAQRAEEHDPAENQGDYDELLIMHAEFQEQRSSDSDDKICYERFCKNAELGETESVVHGLPEIDARPPASVDPFTVDRVRTVLLAFAYGFAFLHRRLLLCGRRRTCECVLVEIDLDIPYEICQQD